MFKRILMLGFKALVSLSPLFLKRQLKKNAKLTSLYSRALQRSGLFYGFPSRKKLDALYKINIAQQDRIIESLDRQRKPQKWNLIVCLPTSLNNQHMSLLVESLENIDEGFEHVFFWCRAELSVNVQQCLQNSHVTFAYSVIQLLSETILANEKQNVLVVQSFNVLHHNILKVLDSYASQGPEIGYLDTDVKNVHGERTVPSFYPDWNPDLLMTTGYISTGLISRDSRNLFKSDNPLALKKETVTEWIIKQYLVEPQMEVFHIPLVLIHKLVSIEHVVTNFSDEIKQLLGRHAELTEDKTDKVIRYQWHIAENSPPLVSLIIPTKNSKNLVKSCIESIQNLTTYRNFEILLVDNGSDEKESLDYFAELEQTYSNTKVLRYNAPFNYSKINNFAVEHAKGSVIGLINNDIEVISPKWLSYMVGHVVRKDIGCVGAKLLYSDERVQHAGVVLGYGGGAGHAHKYFPRYHSGYLKRLTATNNFSAVTAACLLVKKVDYLDVLGLNESQLEVAFNDVDFCLKVLELGKRNIYCAEAELYHHESVSRGHEDTQEKKARFESELAYIQNRWSNYIEHDPAYNPNLTLRRENFSIKE